MSNLQMEEEKVQVSQISLERFRADDSSDFSDPRFNDVDEKHDHETS